MPNWWELKFFIDKVDGFKLQVCGGWVTMCLRSNERKQRWSTTLNYTATTNRVDLKRRKVSISFTARRWKLVERKEMNVLWSPEASTYFDIIFLKIATKRTAEVCYHREIWGLITIVVKETFFIFILDQGNMRRNIILRLLNHKFNTLWIFQMEAAGK